MLGNYSNGAAYTNGNIIPGIMRGYRDAQIAHQHYLPNGLPIGFDPYQILRDLAPISMDFYEGLRLQAPKKAGEVQEVLASRIENVSKQMELKGRIFGVSPS